MGTMGRSDRHRVSGQLIVGIGILVVAFLFYHYFFISPIITQINGLETPEKLPYSLFASLMTAIAMLYGLFGFAFSVLTFVGLQKIRNIESIETELREQSNLLEAQVLYDMGKYDESWERLQELPNKTWEICLRKGLVRNETNDTNDALYFYGLALKFKNHDKNCDTGEVLINMGRTFIRKKLYPEAIASLKEAIHHKPNAGRAYLFKAYAEKRIPNVSMALETVIQGIQVDSAHAPLYFNKACYCALLGKKAEAIEALKKAMDFNQDRYRMKALIDPDLSGISNMPEFREMVLCHAMREKPC